MSTNERLFRQPASKDAEREQLRGAWQRLSEENFPMDVESVYSPRNRTNGYQKGLVFKMYLNLLSKLAIVGIHVGFGGANAQ